MLGAALCRSNEGWGTQCCCYNCKQTDAEPCYEVEPGLTPVSGSQDVCTPSEKPFRWGPFIEHYESVWPIFFVPHFALALFAAFETHT